MAFKESYDRVQLLITAMTKARELGDALLEAEEAGLPLDLSVESVEMPGGRPLRTILVTPTPGQTRLN